MYQNVNSQHDSHLLRVTVNYVRNNRAQLKSITVKVDEGYKKIYIFRGYFPNLKNSRLRNLTATHF